MSSHDGSQPASPLVEACKRAPPPPPKPGKLLHPSPSSAVHTPKTPKMFFLNDIPRGTTNIKLINSLLTPQHLTGEDDTPPSLQPQVQFTCTITNSRLDDELSVAVVECIDTPRWLRHLDLDPYGFPKKTQLGTLWRGVNTTEQDQNGQTEFMRAAIADNLLYAEALAEFSHVDVNVQDNRGRTALHWASVGRLPTIVMLCLSVPDCNVGLKDEDNLTAFDLALQANDDLIPNLFYQNILELDTTAPQTSLLRVLTVTSEPADDLPIFPGAAMFEPARDRNEALVAALIGRRVDLTARNTDGDTALHVAASQVGNTVIAEMLLQAGSDIDATGSGGATALHNAAQTADSEMVKILLNWKADPTATDCDDKTALDWAEQNGQQDITRVLLDDVMKAKNEATQHRQQDIEFVLLEQLTTAARESTTAQATKQSADPNQDVEEVVQQPSVTELGVHVVQMPRTTRYPNELYEAARNGNTEAVLNALEGGADINKPNLFGSMLLHLAAVSGQTKMLEVLLASGADIDRSDGYGWTALHFAASKGHTDTVTALLASGADIDRGSASDYTALHCAAGEGHTDTVTALLAGGALITMDNDGMTALHLAARGGHSEIVTALLVNGADINQARSDGSTALHIAADNGSANVITELLASGAYVNVPDSAGRTALYHAVSTNKRTAAEVLRQNGATVEAGGNVLGLPLTLGSTELTTIPNAHETQPEMVEIGVDDDSHPEMIEVGVDSEPATTSAHRSPQAGVEAVI